MFIGKVFLKSAAAIITSALVLSGSVALAAGDVAKGKNLAEFVSNPGTFVKGIKARFPGLKTAKDKADILAYLKSLK